MNCKDLAESLAPDYSFRSSLSRTSTSTSTSTTAWDATHTLEITNHDQAVAVAAAAAHYARRRFHSRIHRRDQEISITIASSNIPPETTSLLAGKRHRLPPVPPPPREVDFYRNPTILSRLVLNQKYAAAIQRAYRVPEEAATWVCVIRGGKTTATTPTTTSHSRTGRASPPSSTTSSGRRSPEQHPHYTLRQLPVHMACSNLKRTYDSKIRAQLNRLIMVLVVTNPDGSHQPDHQGRVPLHVAIMYGAFADTVKIFLMAHPPSYDSRDEQGRTLSEMNVYRSVQRQQQIQQVLDKGKRFYEMVRQETLKQQDSNKTTAATASGMAATGKTTWSSPASMLMASLASPTHDKEEDDATAATGSTSHVTSISWDQLEKRAIAMEQILTEANEENYVLKMKIQHMVQNRDQLVAELQGRDESKLVREISLLNQQNSKLRERLEHVKTMLETSLQDDESWLMNPTSDGFDPMPLRLLSDIHMIMERYHTLREKNYEQCETLGRIKRVVTEPLSGGTLARGEIIATGNQEEDDEDNTEISVIPGTNYYDPSSDEGRSTLSSSIRSPHRAARVWRQETRQQPQPQATDDKLVDWTPPTSTRRFVASDDQLSDLFRRVSPRTLSGRVLASTGQQQPSVRSQTGHAATAGVLSGTRNSSSRKYQVSEEWGADAITPIAKSRSSVAGMMPHIPRLEPPPTPHGGTASHLGGRAAGSTQLAAPLSEIRWDPTDEPVDVSYDEFDTLTTALRETSGGQDFDHLSVIFRAATHNLINNSRVAESPSNAPTEASPSGYHHGPVGIEASVPMDTEASGYVEFALGFVPAGSDSSSTATTTTTITGPRLPPPEDSTSGGSSHSSNVIPQDIEVPAFEV